MNQAAPEPVVQYLHSQELPKLFRSENFSLFVSTYQAQRILLLNSSSGERMSMLMRTMPRPTGMALSADRLAVCTKFQIWFFNRTPELRGPNGQVLPYDTIYSPRYSHVTGDVMAHQALWWEDRLYFINTRFSCISMLDDKFSFIPHWKPFFIDQLAPEDRCHLNGFCVDAEGLAYATALSSTNVPEGWRADRAKSGVLLDIRKNKIILNGLSMPHSPLVYQGKLWVLDSGTGNILCMDPSKYQPEVFAHCPGFLRGLAFYKDYLFVGLSKMRETTVFTGLPITSLHPELECAVYIFNIKTRQLLGFLKFTKGIEELFDISILPNTSNPHLVGFEEETIEQVVVMP